MSTSRADKIPNPPGGSGQQSGGRRAPRITSDPVSTSTTIPNPVVITEDTTNPPTVNFLNDKLRRMFSELSGINIVMGVRSKETWDDSDLASLKHLNIQGYQSSTPEIQVTILNTALDSLCKRVSANSVGAILVGAWLLRSPEDTTKYVFDRVFMTGQEVEINSLSNEAWVDLQGAERPPVTNQARYLREGAYVCAAMLRLVTKEKDNIMNAWASIRKNYANFYREDMHLDLDLDGNCLEMVRTMFQDRTIIRNTIALFLLNMKNLGGQNKGICRMLFEIHLSYTGMHSYSLLLDCASRLNVKLDVLFELLKHPRHARALSTAKKIIAEYDFPQTDAEKERAKEHSTWKYARIFNPEAFATLQTKNCTQLTALLALVARKVGTANSGDATQIRQISGVLTQNYDWFEDKADKIVAHCRNVADNRPQ